jgi:large subunit ribosomal protein L15
VQLHQLKPIHKPKKKKRLGQGDRFAGRGSGTRGQKARAGRKLKPLIRVLIKRYPKLSGYRQKLKIKNEKLKILNLDVLEKKFKEGEKISPQALLEKNLISKIKGRMPKVKILGKGEIKKKLIIEGCQVSKKAREKIKKAGDIIRI